MLFGYGWRRPAFAPARAAMPKGGEAPKTVFPIRQDHEISDPGLNDPESLCCEKGKEG